MDLLITHLWAAGYDLPPEPSGRLKFEVGNVAFRLDADKPAETPKRRGKKAARTKRARAKP